MREMTLEQFYHNIQKRTECIKQLEGYNLQIHFVEDNYHFTEDDNDYFLSRIADWKEFGKSQGYEPFFYGDEPFRIFGMVHYNLIED